jgi:hypothetical protein
MAILTTKTKGDINMSTFIFKGNGITSLGSIGGEEDLKLRQGINVNPPFDDRCDCCGRHIRELKPFGKAGDPLIGDFNGEVLVKKWRPTGPYDKEAEMATTEAEKYYEETGCKDPLEWLIKKYGKQKGEKLDYLKSLYSQMGSSWECRDCIVLDTDEYFEKLKGRFQKE